MKNTGNGAYHEGPIPSARVREWRIANPGYWRRKKTASVGGGASDLAAVLRVFALQDTCGALQDSWPPQVVALVGIIARLGGDALQETIARDLREIMVTGNAILAALESPAANRSNPPPRESR